MNGKKLGLVNPISALTALTICTATLTPPAAPATPPPVVKGVQAVLLHCWNKDSREALKAVLATENHFAISSAPYLKEHATNGLIDPCTLATGQSDRLGNIGRLMSDLGTTPEFHLIVFAGNLHDDSAGTDLASNARDIWNALIEPHSTHANFYFHFGASLEDHYPNSQVDKIFQEMVSKIPAAGADTLQRLVNAKRFTFQRSPNDGGDSSNLSVDVTVGKTRIASVPITHERHGPSPSSSYQAWSNDGPFVYWNRQDGSVTKREKCGSDNYCGLQAQAAKAISLSSFESKAVAGQIQLLWRPAYNLFSYTDQTSGNVTTRIFTKPAGTRSDGAKSGFDPWEADVLKQYLQ